MLGTPARTTSIFFTSNTIGNFFIASSNTKTSRYFVAMNEFRLVVQPGETVELSACRMKAKAQSIEELGPKPILLQQILLFLIGAVVTFCSKH